MNIDFSNSPGFSSYVVLLLISGIAMLVISAINAGGQSVGWRIFNVLVGLAFVGYGFYLGFIFTGGTYWIIFKVFILPVVLIANFFKSMNSRRQTDAARLTAPQAYMPQQPMPQPDAPYAAQPVAQPYDQFPPVPQAPAPQAPAQG
ncbi:putative membrane protein SirB2 [Streptacidiphilus sp. MAP12-20]|uniref:hypothetical protein n=1 Tax=Streptacidiphilus sp. MAP12-20 TaxID=3156299 RepID=UPI0035134C86